MSNRLPGNVAAEDDRCEKGRLCVILPLPDADSDHDDGNPSRTREPRPGGCSSCQASVLAAHGDSRPAGGLGNAVRRQWTTRYAHPATSHAVAFSIDERNEAQSQRVARGHSSLFFHDIRVEVAGDGAAIAAFEGLSRASSVNGETRNVRKILHLELRRNRNQAPNSAPSIRCLRVSGDDRLVVDHDAAQAIVDLESHHIELHADFESPLDPKSPAALVFTTALKLALRELGIFTLHAAAVLVDEAEAIVIPGDSGIGKTTTALALVDSGCTPMTDDELFVRWDSGAWELLTIPQAFRTTPETLAAFPRWAPHRGTLLPDFAKYELHVGDAAPTAGRFQGAARLLFPQRVSNAETELAPLPIAEALGELMVASPLVALGGASSSRRHADFLHRFVAGSQPMRLNLGADLLAAPKRTAERILALLKQPAQR